MPIEEDSPKRRHVNAAQRRALKAAEVSRFMTQYARPSQKGVEPNDRRYDREVERRTKTLDPIELDRLMRDDED